MCSRRFWTGRPVLFRFGPSNALVPQHRRYVPGTMVLETTWQTPTGWMIVQDFLAIGPAEDGARRPDYRRAPTDTGAIGALVRIATCISGQVEVMVNCDPLFNYGTAGGTWSYQGDGYNAMTVAAKEGDVQLELAGSIRLGVLGARGYGRKTLTEGQSAYVVCPGATRRFRPATRRRSPPWTPPSVSGATGWPRPRSPITRGSPTSTAAR